MSGAFAQDRIIYVDNFDGFILRANFTDNQSSFVAFLLGENFSANIAPIGFAFSNSTFSNNTIGYNIDFSGRCDSEFRGAIDGKNQSHNMYYCKFIVPNEWAEGSYNLTFSLNDSFGNNYSISKEFKFVKNLVSIKGLTFENPLGEVFLDDSNRTNTSVKMKFIHNIGKSALSVALYNKTPTGIQAYDPFNTSQFVEFVPNWNVYESIYGWKDWYWAEIRIHYTDAQIAALGLQESTLKLKSYNETTNSWQTCSGSSVNTAANYVYCNSTHFSTWTVVGDPVSTPSPAPASGGSSGGGGGSSAATTTTPVAPAEEIKTETTVAPVRTPPLEIKTFAVTSTNIPVIESDRRQELAQIISPQDLGIQKIDAASLNIVQRGSAETTFTTSLDSIDKISKIEGLGESTKNAIGEIKNQLSADQAQSVSIQTILQVFEVKSTDSGKSTFVSKVSMKFTAEGNLENVKIVQVIPKSVAQDVSEVVFSGQQPLILQADPVVQWSFESVTKGETKDLSYLVKKKVDSLDATTVAVARQQQVTETEQAPMYDYVTIAVAVFVIIVAISAFILIRRRK